MNKHSICLRLSQVVGQRFLGCTVEGDSLILNFQSGKDVIEVGLTHDTFRMSGPIRPIDFRPIDLRTNN